MRQIVVYAAWIVGAATIVVACGGHNSGFGDDGGVDGSADGQAADGPGFGFEGGGDTGPNGCTQCSADLHEILTCGVEPDRSCRRARAIKGCGPTGCIAACDAAAANKSSIGCDYYSLPSDDWRHVEQRGSRAAASPRSSRTTGARRLKVTLVWKGNTIDATPLRVHPEGLGSSITYAPIPTTGIPAEQHGDRLLEQYATEQGRCSRWLARLA